MPKNLRVLMSVGEVSGDLHASAVIRALKQQIPAGVSLDVAGIAGPMMQAQGCQVIREMSDLNVMGIGDVIMALPRIKGVERDFCSFATKFKPNVVILTDFTSFHIGLGRKMRAQGLFVIHYIAPKLWAWGAGRLPKLLQSQNKLACIFPFEQQWFQSRGIDADYVGNPSAYACREGWSKAELKSRLGLAADTPLLALLPGSRPAELKRHVALFADAFVALKKHMPELAAVATLAPSVAKSALQPLVDVGVMLLGRTEEHYALRADAAVAVSGTATLELALWETPTVLVYRTSALSWAIGSRLVKGRCVGLANILLQGDVPSDQGVIPELLQDDCTLENIKKEVLLLLQGENKQQKEAFSALKTLLGEENPADKVASLCWAQRMK